MSKYCCDSGCQFRDYTNGGCTALDDPRDCMFWVNEGIGLTVQNFGTERPFLIEEHLEDCIDRTIQWKKEYKCYDPECRYLVNGECVAIIDPTACAFWNKRGKKILALNVGEERPAVRDDGCLYKSGDNKKCYALAGGEYCCTKDTCECHQEKGMKADESKANWDLLPMDAVEEIVKRFTYGAEKYAPNNWKKVEASRYRSALLRHYTAYVNGEKDDPDPNMRGLSHLSAVAWNAIVLLYKELHNDE